jgi:tetratricopeptide (TPR) repeat protein
LTLRASGVKFAEEVIALNLRLATRWLVTPMLVLLSSWPGMAQPFTRGAHGSNATAQTGEFGSVNFPISCSPQVQGIFNTGEAQLDNFQYEQSAKTFQEVAQRDPKCAMAYWGQAMSLYHQLWEWPDAGTLKKGWQLIQKAQQIGAKSARERQYIQAAAAYYQPNPKLNDEARAVAYSRAMEELHEHYPKDTEAAALYALSLIAQRTSDKTAEMTHRKQAIAILDKLFATEPDNPGVAHFLIHASDTPVLAPEGLAAARRYAKIAPGSAHALHMPSHIFTDLGLWQESIESNLASAAAAEKATTSGEYDASGHQLHAMTFLEYAYLESGQDSSARQLIRQLKKVPGLKAGAIADEQAMFTTEYATETHNWKQAAALVSPPGLYAEEKEQIDLARAIGRARTGDISGAKKALNQLKKAQAEAAGGRRKKNAKMSGESMDQLMAESWIALAQGQSAKALSKMEAAVEREDDEAWKDGQAAVQIPAREMLADLLMALRQPAKALPDYEAVLKQSPNRFDALDGAARAAQLAGNIEAARRYYAQLVKICGPNADRPELREAREQLAEK